VRVPLAFAAAVAVVAAAGCSSSKPAYCTDRTNLQNSVKGLTSSGISGLKTQAKQVESDATTLVNSAKSDFPNETSAITSSVDALKTSLTGLGSSPSAAQIATVTQSAASVVSSVKSFVDASNSKCS
jgi:phage-related protein